VSKTTFVHDVEKERGWAWFKYRDAGVDAK